MKLKPKVILGIDLGTSGLRACIVRRQTINNEMFSEEILFEHTVAMPVAKKCLESNRITQSPEIWIKALKTLLSELTQQIDLKIINHLIVDATSSTVLLFEPKEQSHTHALMYNDSHSVKHALAIDLAVTQAKQAGSIHCQQNQNGAQGASCTLAKVLSLLESYPQNKFPVICHQVDFINHFLCGITNVTDENNALKLGYDLINQAWPNWVVDLLAKSNCNITLPKVVKPGEFLANISPKIAQTFGFNPELKIMAGTTDSIAGFLASGADQPGDAVTSLGSTIAVKYVSNTPIFDADYGLYSHRLGKDWLVGGASNAGGEVLKNFYTIEQLKQLNQLITERDIEHFLQQKSTSYYPLLTAGERFPIADAHFAPKLPPRPFCDYSEIESSAECLKAHKRFLLQLLNGLTEIEVLSYQTLTDLLQPPNNVLNKVYAVGGGTLSPAWMKLREHLLGVHLCSPKHSQAAYGVTRLINNKN